MADGSGWEDFLLSLADRPFYAQMLVVVKIVGFLSNFCLPIFWISGGFWRSWAVETAPGDP